MRNKPIKQYSLFSLTCIKEKGKYLTRTENRKQLDITYWTNCMRGTKQTLSTAVHRSEIFTSLRTLEHFIPNFLNDYNYFISICLTRN